MNKINFFFKHVFSIPQTLLKTFDLIIIDGDVNDIRLVGTLTLILILILAIVGMDWVTRVSYEKNFLL